jgi:hypothetical protein
MQPVSTFFVQGALKWGTPVKAIEQYKGDANFKSKIFILNFSLLAAIIPDCKNFMKQSRRCFLLLIVLFCLHFCICGQKNHQEKRISGSTGNQLEVVDWGGKGQAILFLTGLGNTAHVYDGFAPRFTNNFHVYGMSRRGYGASEQTKTGMGIDTLAKDILKVIDALDMDKVILIGHSIAGGEITTFASQYPNRVLKVIYLDAAYDHSNLGQLPFPEFPERKTKDSVSVQGLNDDLKIDRGFMFHDDEFRHCLLLKYVD